MSVRIALIALALGATATASAQAPRLTTADSLTITFIANEGVMLSSGSQKVLIDGLFLKYKTGFPTPADSTQRRLEQALPPFDGVNVILATHQHGDHFHSAPVAAHMRANPRATLVTSQQVIDSLRRFPPARTLPASRFLPRTMPEGTRRRDVVNGVVIEVLGIPHGGGWRSRGLEHVAYIVEMGGKRVLHVGDASFSDEVLAPFHLDTARIDVALLPAWLVADKKGAQLVERWIRPKQVVGIHVGEGEEDRVSSALRAALPGAVAFTRSLETRRW